MHSDKSSSPKSLFESEYWFLKVIAFSVDSSLNYITSGKTYKVLEVYQDYMTIRDDFGQLMIIYHDNCIPNETLNEYVKWHFV